MNTKPEIGQIVQFSIENEIFCGVVVKNLENTSIIEFDSSSLDKIRSTPLYGRIVVSHKK